jgi:uncharacterized protein with GYD domain
MAKYVSLIQWTDQGIKSYPDTTERAKTASAAAAKFGGKLTNLVWTIGPYDIVTFGEFPDDESVTAFSLMLGAQGNVRTTTMRAFDSAEMAAIIAKTK